jgi:PAS domain S-box-containing protein
VRDNEVYWYSARGKVFKRNDKGETVQYISLIHDITDEVELRIALSDRSKYAENLIDSSVDRMFVIDRNFTVLAWNKKCEEYYNKWKENVIGKNYLDLFPMIAENSEVMEAILQAMNGEQSYLSARKEIYLNTITERFYIPLKTEEGEVNAILCVLHDVTRTYQAREELKHLNNSLEQKNVELENKHEEITTFAFVASHDLKEPLRKIHTFSDWLLNTEGEHLSKTGKDYLQRINSSVKRVDSLIEDILILTKIHADRQHNQFIDLNTILIKVQEECKQTIEEKQARIESDLLPVVLGNENQMILLLRNLISNAIKFQGNQKTPELKISCQIIAGDENKSKQILLDPEKEYAKVTFTDNGIGIDPKYAKKIFQVFQRLHGRDEYAGTGMGLAICKKIMENHKGMIELESSSDNGSAFACYFPL